ncbi:indole-3-glycerol phosphate synthase TrpC [Desulfurivibrio alkaliphilus]|uniref:Indole-3-glycerol phosphate synthase n=1 Tax=Desulfurivibrio alkaliphilus (strain DSM 19089 / UNIQEM U267 / AHT2) TaxID=589865 RepID=D6YZZ9_DESAT|nr:indole-3-glycerol phosphate synthase TrpC [Desulfurivibrio alkaliphilus]ADH85156.1 Indole-3-glycerol-phosphate synthase [Desulfurivibrio alkaliphilus AHT 2]
MILDRIVARKKEEIAALKRRGLGAPADEPDPPRGFIAALTGCSEVAVIAELKKASPSKGVIRPDFDPAAIAAAYQRGGAAALSILTDVDFFQGSLAYIPQVRRLVPLPVLRKDFLLDPLQVEEASRYGADAILLIAAILTVPQMEELRLQAEELGMDVLVEIHDEAEAEQALAAGARLIGVNNRDLRDFSMDLNTTFRLRKLIPPTIPLVSESGIRDHADITALAAHGIAAALVGETLMRAEDPGQALLALRGAV